VDLAGGLVAFWKASVAAVCLARIHRLSPTRTQRTAIVKMNPWLFGAIPAFDRDKNRGLRDCNKSRICRGQGSSARG
jgi:hypothetical protein